MTKLKSWYFKQAKGKNALVLSLALFGNKSWIQETLLSFLSKSFYESLLFVQILVWKKK